MAESDRLSVCFVMFGCYPLFNRGGNHVFGGSELELYNLGICMARRGVRVDFIVGDYGQDDVEYREGIRLLKVRYMKLDKYRSLPYRILRYWQFLKVLYRQNADVFITKTASEIIGWMVLVQKILKRSKVVFRLGSDRDTDIASWRGMGIKFYHLYRLGLLKSDLVYTQSQVQKERLMKAVSVSSHVVKNAFILNKAVSPLRDQGYILWVSRCEALKRPMLYVRLAARLPEQKFIIIMPHTNKGDRRRDKKTASIAACVKKAAAELPNLSYIGFVPFDDIQEYYDGARLFVNTSEYEGFPNSFIQACLGRTGILSFRVNPDGFITDEGIGICCNDSLDRAVEFIRGMDDIKAHEMGRNAYRYVAENHNAERIAEGYIRDFAHVAQKEHKMQGRCCI